MTEAFDLPILLWLQEHFRTGVLARILEGITFFGDKWWFWLGICAVLFIIPRTRYMAIPAAISFCITIGINSFFLKNIIGRVRPFVYTDLIVPAVEKLPDGFSFPSGHTASAFAVALVLLWADKRIGIPAVIFAAIMGFSRIALGVHYPTDVIAAFLLAFAVSIIVWLLWCLTPYARRHVNR